MKVVWLRAALDDRASQIEYIAQHDRSAAVAADDRIEGAVAGLIAYPLIGKPGRVRGTRELVIAGTPYLIAYRVAAEAVIVLRLMHGRQRWPRRF